MTVGLAFAPEREEAELREYLGDRYQPDGLTRYEAMLEEEVAAVGDEAQLYRTSTAYLYNLTAFAMSGTKLPYLQMLVEKLPRGAKILDYGCGIGSDGLLLLEAGYDVEFADFANPSSEYLRWRLRNRGVETEVHDLDSGVPGGFDAAYAFDVVEHVPDAFALIREMESRARMVEVNLLEYEPHEQTLHYRVPIREVLFHAAGRDLRDYQIHHGSSHVILYGTDQVGISRRLRNFAMLAAVRTRRAASRLRS